MLPSGQAVLAGRYAHGQVPVAPVSRSSMPGNSLGWPPAWVTLAALRAGPMVTRENRPLTGP